MIPQTLFYSWQSDLPSDTNQRAISGCIKSAMVSIEDELDDVKLNYDEATRDETGSPDIPATILRKISGADLFICDVTTINSNDTATRKTPNPNVLLKLGFAVAVLGWERVIMVFNQNYGDFRLELPFDLEKRRVIPFKITDKKDKSGKGDLTKKLEAGIKAIVEMRPPKPTDSRQKSPDEIKRAKDISSVESLLGVIHIQTMDYFIDSLPDRVIDRIFFFWHSFQEIYDTTAFHIYDSHLAKLVREFRDKWGETLGHGDMYSGSQGRGSYIFHKPMDIFPNKKAEEAYDQIAQEAAELKFFFKELIQYLRDNYIEIDIDELSKNALQAYVDHEKSMLDLLGE
jgi:hypothetical protein